LSPLPDPEKAEAKRKSVAAFDKAIQIDARFAPAYYQQASVLYELKQHQRAIKDYDKVLELEPRNGAAFNDRALAKMELNDFYGAIRDFTSAIVYKDKLSAIDMTYEYRAEANSKVGHYSAAVADYTERIRALISHSIFLMDLAQIRKIYPEYKSISDDALCKKLQSMFFPNMKYEDFFQQLTEKNAQNGGLKDFVLPEVYGKRADAYLASGDFRKAVIDYQRATAGFPEFASDRWHLIFKAAESDIYLDSQTTDFSSPSEPRFWIKSVSTSQKNKGAYSLLNEVVNCTLKSINGLSINNYNPQGAITSSNEVPTGWQPIIPESLGERLHGGVCR
jgi:tetratricopeptide (TPR) repeat protein